MAEHLDMYPDYIHMLIDKYFHELHHDIHFLTGFLTLDVDYKSTFQHNARVMQCPA